MLAGALALVGAALFTGAAIYINIAEQPARLGIPDGPLLAEWRESYERGQVMQAALAIVGLVAGAVAWWQTGRPAFLIGGFLLGANWPYTLAVILPVNKALKAIAAERAGPESRRMIERWGRLHAGRSALGVGSVLVLFWAAVT